MNLAIAVSLGCGTVSILIVLHILKPPSELRAQYIHIYWPARVPGMVWWSQPLVGCVQRGDLAMDPTRVWLEYQDRKICGILA